MLPDGFFRLCELGFSFNPNISTEWVMVGPQRSHTSRAQGAWEKKKNGDDAHSVTRFHRQYPFWESITCKCVLENGSMLIENMVISIHRLGNVREMDLWLNCFSDMCIKICDMGPRVWEKKRTQGAHQPTLRVTIQKFNLINQYHTCFFLYSISNSPRPFKTQACLRKRTHGAPRLTKQGSKQASKQRSGEAPVAHFKLSVR